MFSHRGACLAFCVLLYCADVAMSMQIMTLTLGGSPTRATTSDDGGTLCTTDEDCALMDRFVCTSLDGPSCSHIVKPEPRVLGLDSTQEDLKQLLGNIVQKIKVKKKTGSGQQQQTKKKQQQQTQQQQPPPPSSSSTASTVTAQAQTEQEKVQSLVDMFSDPNAKDDLADQLKKLLGESGALPEGSQLETFVVGPDGKLKRASGEELAQVLDANGDGAASAELGADGTMESLLLDAMAGATTGSADSVGDDDDIDPESQDQIDENDDFSEDIDL